jgi:hypothetical protein
MVLRHPPFEYDSERELTPVALPGAKRARARGGSAGCRRRGGAGGARRTMKAPRINREFPSSAGRSGS